MDKKRKKKTSNTEWTNPHDPDAKVTKMKDGRTHLAHKAEHAVDLDTGAIVAVTLQGADQGDTTTIVETVTAAAEQVEDAQRDGEAPQALDELVGDKGYHSNQSGRTGPRPPRLREMHAEFGLTSIIATHNPRLAAACDRVLRLEQGQLRQR